MLVQMILFTFLTKGETNSTCSKGEIIWKNMLRIISNCNIGFNQDSHLAPLISRCIKVAACETLNHVLKFDDLEIYNGINIVKYKKGSNNISLTKNHSCDPVLQDVIMNMLLNIGENYSFKMNLSEFVLKDKAVDQGRYRRRRHHVMPLMMFGIVGLSIILVPMGFKFLSILGGKALLLAKMALILSSIQGLKKLATSNYNYGLYQTPSIYPWHYERYGHESIPDTQSKILPPAFLQN